MRQHFGLITRLFVRGISKRRAVEKSRAADGVQKKVFSHVRVPLVLLVVTAKVHNVPLYVVAKARVYTSPFAVAAPSVVVKGAVPLSRVHNGVASVARRCPSLK